MAWGDSPKPVVEVEGVEKMQTQLRACGEAMPPPGLQVESWVLLLGGVLVLTPPLQGLSYLCSCIPSTCQVLF